MYLNSSSFYKLYGNRRVSRPVNAFDDFDEIFGFLTNPPYDGRLQDHAQLNFMDSALLEHLGNLYATGMHLRQDFGECIEVLPYVPSYECSPRFMGELAYYFTHEKFCRDSIKSVKYDLVFMGVMAMVLMSSEDTLRHMEITVPNFSTFMEHVRSYLADINYQVFRIPDTQTLFVPGTFSILNGYFNEVENTKAPKSEDYFNFETKRDMKLVHQALGILVEQIKHDGGNIDWSHFIAVNEDILSLFDTRCKEYVFPYNQCITGTACVGKTTFLAQNSEGMHVNSYSRRDLGTFGGKASDPAPLGSLHFAYQHVEKFRNVILDRNAYDNFIWRFIMAIVDPSVPYDMWVSLFMKFIKIYISETQFAKLANDKMVIIIESRPQCNRTRMFLRGMDGDLNRARIMRYVDAQNFGYLASAAIFNWKVVFTEYASDNDGHATTHCAADSNGVDSDDLDSRHSDNNVAPGDGDDCRGKVGLRLMPDNLKSDIADYFNDRGIYARRDAIGCSDIRVYPENYVLDLNKRFKLNWTYEALNAQLRHQGCSEYVVTHNFEDPVVFAYARLRGIYK